MPITSSTATLISFYASEASALKNADPQRSHPYVTFSIYFVSVKDRQRLKVFLFDSEQGSQPFRGRA